MKTLLKTLCLLVVVAGSSLAQNQNVRVNANKKLNHDFSKYKTFAYASQVDNKLDEGYYFLNDLVLKDQIRKAVSYELESRGYKKMSGAADLLINFRVFDKPTKIEGYTGYGTTYFGTNEVREPEDVQTFELQPGSLIVNIVDTKTGQMVWRGFASGLMDGNVFNKKEDMVKRAVHLIFEEYDFKAEGVAGR